MRFGIKIWQTMLFRNTSKFTHPQNKHMSSPELTLQSQTSTVDSLETSSLKMSPFWIGCPFLKERKSCKDLKVLPSLWTAKNADDPLARCGCLQELGSGGGSIQYIYIYVIIYIIDFRWCRWRVWGDDVQKWCYFQETDRFRWMSKKSK